MSAQAVMKVVPNGGTSKGVGRQMDYLTRDGNIDAERSERYQGIEISNKEDIKELERAWDNQARNAAKGTSDQQLTTHLVASFPPGTDEEKAKEIGRAWADEMFNSGKHGGKWDYVTVFHGESTDVPEKATEHPHMHVVVNRRGLDEDGAWLKISKRDPHMNYDNMRETLAEVARERGLELDASSREERGLEAVDNRNSLAKHHMAQRYGDTPMPDAFDNASEKAAAERSLADRAIEANRPSERDDGMGR